MTMASAAILVGGAARRYDGQDKGGLKVNGQTILERQLEALAPLASDIMLVGRPRPTIAGTRQILDRDPGCGPLAGLEAALEAAQDDVLILLACDMPFVTTAFLAHLLALAHTADAVVPRGDRGYHPLCAVYHRHCLSAVKRRLGDGRLALKGLLDDVLVCTIVPEDLTRFGGEARLLANVNTPADLNKIESLLHHES